MGREQLAESTRDSFELVQNKASNIIDFTRANGNLVKKKAEEIGNSPHIKPIKETSQIIYVKTKEAVTNRVIDPLLIKFADRIKPMIPKALKYCVDLDPRFPADFNEQMERIKEEGRTIVIPVSHTSIWDTAVIAVNVISKMREYLDPEEKIVMPVTDAFGSGHLGGFLQGMANIMEEGVKPYGITELWPILRQKDIKAGAVLTEIHKKNALKIPKVAKDKNHMIIAPEGTVNGGRWKKKWLPFKGRNGMQPPESTTPILGKMISEAMKNGDKITFLPTAIIGSENIFSPNYNLPTVQAFFASYAEKNIGTVQVKMAQFIDGEEVWELAKRRCIEKVSGEKVDRKDIEKEVGMVLMGIIATMKPEKQRGYYKDVFVRSKMK